MTEDGLSKILIRERPPRYNVREPEVNYSTIEPESRYSAMVDLSSKHFRRGWLKAIEGGLFAVLGTAGAAAIIYGTQGPPEYIAIGFFAFYIGSEGGIPALLEAQEDFSYSRKIKERIKEAEERLREAIRNRSAIIELPREDYQIL